MRSIVYLVILYASWLGMMAIHESGHALAGWITGGHVVRVVLPLWGFSRTDLSPDPNPVVEVWAGPLGGGIVPLLVRLAIRRPWKVWRFFTGFCLIANGSYLAAGWAMHAGDAWELVQMGTPRWVLIVVGGAMSAGGLIHLASVG